MLATRLGVSIGGALVSLFANHWKSALLAFRMSFVCVGVVALASALIFRRIDETESGGQTRQRASRRLFKPPR